jgi:DNA-binding response OmpR family regulator/signal transduction histidine kinase
MEYKGRILIVDDQLSVREVFRSLLMEQGYDLVFASNGPEAMAAAVELIPDLILLDVMMPGMDGFEVCRQMRTHPILAEVPIIMVTALDDMGSVLQGLEAGADDFMTKPFNHAELQARVRTTVRLNRYRLLLSAQTKFDWVIDQSNDGYLVIDESDHIRYTNPRARQYLDLTTAGAETDPVTFFELARKQYHFEPEVAWDDWPNLPKHTLNASRYLVRPESPTNQVFWLQVNILDLPPGSREGRIIHLRDVTLELVLQRDMWEFQTMMAHKLRTPMTSIYSGLLLLKEDQAISADPDTMKLLDIVMRGAERLQSDVESILKYLNTPDLAQPDSGFSLAQLGPLITKLGSDLGIEAMTVSGLEAAGNVRLLLQDQAVELILWEIFENAKKFHPKRNPMIEVSAALLEDDSTRLRIKIMDDGLTLSPEQFGQILLPFYQGEKYLTGETTGMGLGLSRAALLIWGVGGTCRLYNRDDRPGLVVELSLPFEQEGEQNLG